MIISFFGVKLFVAKLVSAHYWENIYIYSNSSVELFIRLFQTFQFANTTYTSGFITLFLSAGRSGPPVSNTIDSYGHRQTKLRKSYTKISAFWSKGSH